MKEKSVKNLKVLSKIVYVFAKIVRIFTMVGIVCMTLCMIFIPIALSNVKYTDNEFKYKDKVVLEIVEDDDSIVLKNGDESFKLTKDEGYIIKEFKDILEKTPMEKLTLYIELALLFTIAILVVTYIALKTSEKLFRNIYEKETPFISENTGHIRFIANSLIYIIAISVISNIILSLILDYKYNLNISLTTVCYILVIYIISYIFEYGELLQSKSKKKIYNETEED